MRKADHPTGRPHLEWLKLPNTYQFLSKIGMPSSRSISKDHQLPEAKLNVAHNGITRFQTTWWTYHLDSSWGLDVINQGQQRQRIGSGKAFTRMSGVVAFYAPKCVYHEYQTAGETIHESFMTFSTWGELEKMLRPLVGKRGWCHIHDPEHTIAGRLQRLGDLVFQRRPGYQLLAHAAMLELLGILLVTSMVAPTRRELQSETQGSKRHLVQTVERFVRDHIAESLGVEDLAVHLKMSVPTFARIYPRLARETPCRTIRRLKMEAAKSLLLANNLSVKECALQLGFSSEFHFSRTFKRIEGLAPSDYVKALSDRTAG